MFVSFRSVQAAVNQAVCDFRAVGLNTSDLHGCEVVCVPFGWHWGWAWDTGEIEIPRLALPRLAQLFLPEVEAVSLRDIIRHEMAHALAFCHPHLVRRGGVFVRTFGGSHDLDEWPEGKEPEYDRDNFVSEYATTSPCEDFAETVMVYTRHQGRMGRYRKRAGLWKKLLYVMAIAQQIRTERIPLA